MKILVRVKATRADETINLVKALLLRVSIANQVNIEIWPQTVELDNVIRRYLPADSRVCEPATGGSGDVLFDVIDTEMPSIPESWDLDPTVAAKFVKLEAAPVEPPPPVNLYPTINPEDFKEGPELKIDPNQIYHEEEFTLADDEAVVLNNPEQELIENVHEVTELKGKLNLLSTILSEEIEVEDKGDGTFLVKIIK